MFRDINTSHIIVDEDEEEGGSSDDDSSNVGMDEDSDVSVFRVLCCGGGEGRCMCWGET